MTRHTLLDGDVIQLGNVLLTYRAGRLDEAAIIEASPPPACRRALATPPPAA